MNQKKVGFLGGTFDPIHNGHLNLAIEALEILKLDEVWFCPTYLSPHKTKTPPLSSKHRLKMVELALEKCPSFKIIEDELKAQKVTYTYQTLTALKENPTHSNIDFTLLLSQDLLVRLSEWYQIKNLIEEFDLFIASRGGHLVQMDPKLDPKLTEKLRQKTHPIRLMEISSQSLRERLKNKLYCRHLCPGKVLDYIYENDLY